MRILCFVAICVAIWMICPGGLAASARARKHASHVRRTRQRDHAGASPARQRQPSIDKALWARLDRLNAGLRKAARSHRPLQAAQLARALAEAEAILRADAFEQDYQHVRGAAFDRDDFSQAKKLVKRAAPALVLAFDGDSDTHLINFAFFKELAEPKSEAAEFFREYPAFLDALPVLAPDWSYRCLVEFDLLAQDRRPPGPDARPEGQKIIETWRGFEGRWKEPFFVDAAKRGLACLLPG